MPYYRYSLESRKNIASKNWATFDNIYEGEKIIFNPDLYQRPQKETIFNACWSLAQQFNRLRNDIYFYTLEMVRPINAGDRSVQREEHYSKMRAKLDSLEKQYDPLFAQPFIDQKMRLYELFNPLRLKEYSLYQLPIDSEAVKAFFESEEFENHLTDILHLIKSVDTRSWFLTDNNFVFLLVYQIPHYLEKWPALSDKYNITKEECLTKLDSMVFNAKNPAGKEGALMSIRRRYTYMDSLDRANRYEKMLYEQFPDGWAVNSIEEEKNRVSWSSLEPYPAPDFTVTSVNGETIKLSDYRGKFVYIDFWGSWCVPCRMESAL